MTQSVNKAHGVLPYTTCSLGNCMHDDMSSCHHNPILHKTGSPTMSASAGYLGNIHSNGHGSASSSRLSGDRVFASFRSQKLEVQANQWHRAELVLPNIPKGARYARLVLSGRMVGYGQPQEQFGPRFTQPHLSWGSHRAKDIDDAVLFYSDASATLRLEVIPDSIPSILDDDPNVVANSKAVSNQAEYGDT